MELTATFYAQVCGDKCLKIGGKGNIHLTSKLTSSHEWAWKLAVLVNAKYLYLLFMYKFVYINTCNI